MELMATWTQIGCITCKALFAMPEGVNKRYRDNHKDFHCPYCGQDQHYLAESKEEKFRRLYEQEKSCCISAREEANRIERRLIATKGVVTKLKKRGK